MFLPPLFCILSIHSTHIPWISVCCYSVTQLCPNSSGPHGLQHARLSCPSPSFGACSNLCPLRRWCHPAISSSVITFSCCLRSFPASWSFPVSRLFASGDHSIGASASASVLPVNIQDWFSLGLTGLIFLQSKGLSRVFSNTTVQKHQFFGTQLTLWSNSHIHTWLLEKTSFWLYGPLFIKQCLCFLIHLTAHKWQLRKTLCCPLCPTLGVSLGSNGWGPSF